MLGMFFLEDLPSSCHTRRDNVEETRVDHADWQIATIRAIRREDAGAFGYLALPHWQKQEATACTVKYKTHDALGANAYCCCNPRSKFKLLNSIHRPPFQTPVALILRLFYAPEAVKDAL